VTAVDVEDVEAVEAACVVRASQVMVIVAAVAAVEVAVGVATRLISTETQPPEEYATSIGPLEPAIAASTAPTDTRQGFRGPHPPHRPRIIPPISSHLRDWP